MHLNFNLELFILLIIISIQWTFAAVKTHSGTSSRFSSFGSSSYQQNSNRQYISARECDRPEPPDFGTIRCSMDNYEFICNGECNDGYSFPDGSRTLKLKCNKENGIFEPYNRFPSCRRGGNFGSNYGQQQLVDDDHFSSSRSSGYTSYNSANNRGYSSYGTDHCPDLQSPQNGGKSCRMSNGKWTCTITCSTGYEFPDGSSQIEVTCLQSIGVWSPIGTFEDCSLGGLDSSRYGQQQLVDDDDDFFSSSSKSSSYSSFGTDHCPDLVSPSNGGKSCRMSNGQWTCTITCSPGYQFPDGSSQIEVICRQSVGVWSPTGEFDDCHFGGLGSNYGQQPLVDEDLFSNSKSSSYNGYGTGGHTGFSEDRCPDLIVPSNGGKSCRMSNGKWTCTITCSSGYQFKDGSSQIEVACFMTIGVWSPTGTFEDCVSVSGGTYAKGHYQGSSGSSSHTQHQITNERYTSSNLGTYGGYGQDLCPKLTIPRNGGKQCQMKDYKWTCTISCISGYQFPDGRSQLNVTCPMSSGVWSPTDTFEDCKSKAGSNYGYGSYQESHYSFTNEDLCKKLNSPMNGRKSCSMSENRWMCTASCMTGYQFPDGTTQINVTCYRNIGVWSPVDTFEDCSSTSGGYTGGGSSYYQETSGGNYNSYGQSSGHGIYNQNTAQKLCKDLRKPNNGMIHCTGNDIQKTCQVTCNPGYEFSDRLRQVNAICYERDGRWSPRDDFGDCQLLCNPPCENGGTCLPLNQCECTDHYRGIRCQYAVSLCDFSRLSRGSLLTADCEHLSEYTECHVSCPPGSTFDPPSTSLFRCTVDGLWNPPFAPTCTQGESGLCETLPTPNNGRIECSENYEIKACTVSCLPGHAFDNGHTELSVQCDKDTGEWSSELELTDCERDLCRHLDQPRNGRIECTENSEARKCIASCIQGYIFDSGLKEISLMCYKKIGEWSSPVQLSDCERDMCGAFPPPNNAHVECTENIKIKRCTVSCLPGHAFDNGFKELSVQCNKETGQWAPGTEELSNCEAICSPECRNGGRCLSHNSCLCPSGFRGERCEYSLSLCDPEKRLASVTYACNISQTETLCQISCPNGYKLQPGHVNEYRCQLDGTWIPDLKPTCILALTDNLIDPRYAGYNEDYGFNKNEIQTSQSHRITDREHGFQQHRIGQNSVDDDVDVFNQNSIDGDYEFDQQPIPDADLFGQKTVDKDHMHIKPQFPKPEAIHDRQENGLEQFDINEKDIINQDNTQAQKNKYDLVDEDNQVVQTNFDKNQPDYERETEIFSNKERASNYKGLCSIWGFYHYRTFDGGVYTYPSTCWHVLANTENDDTIISVKSICDGSLPCERLVFIKTTHNRYLLSYNDGLNKHGVQLEIPLQDNDLLVEYIGRYLVVRTHVGFTIWINEENAVLIEADSYMQGKTEGLCGNYDMQMDGTFSSADGTKTHDVFLFADSWKLSEPDGACVDEAVVKSPCSSETHEKQMLYNKANIECAAIYNKVFEKCAKILDVQLYLTKCQMDCCNAMSVEGCQCSSLAEFVLECSRAGVDMSQGWRHPGLCPLTCANNTEYNECGPGCPATCTDQEPACQQENCIDGCHCPEGTVLEEGICIPVEDCPCHQGEDVYSKGETIEQDCNTCVCEDGHWECTDVICPATCTVSGPHITTFDGLAYDFIGMCPHYLVESDKLAFNIQIDYGTHCRQKTLGNACIKSITIQTTEGAVVKIKSTMEVSVNEKDMPELPISAPGIYVGRATSLYIRARLTNGLEILWDLDSSIQVYAPDELFNQVQGLCGTYSKSLQDEFLTPEGDIEASAGTFAGKWKVEEECVDVKDMPIVGDKVCDVFPERRSTATGLCHVLKEKEFSECHGLVDYVRFYEDCLEDVCSCKGDIEECICLSLSNYANTCARKGRPLSWRHVAPSCGISCPFGQIYLPCANPCAYSCGEIAHIDSDCRDHCVEGCVCPQGQTLNVHNQCVSVSMCSCLHSGHLYPPEFQQRRGKEMCECSRGQWDCHEASTADLLLTPPPRVAKSCNPGNHEVFTNCLSTCPVTCSNYHHHQPCTVDICEPGCKCETGYVLVASTGKCVRPRDCPCHHAGRSYKEGDEVNMDCNSCVCKGGTWSCDSKICPGVCSIWGDSHFETFDGKLYDFEGSCDYVLVKARMSDNTFFSVVSQNIPCGIKTTTNCGRTVSISLGDTTLTLTRTHPLPVVPKNSKITLSSFGIFILVDTDIGISLQWDKNTRVYITAQPIWKNKLQGLCGDFNSDASDDFRSPSGGIPLVMAKDFADSWRVYKFCKLAKQPHDACDENPERRTWSTEKCSVLKGDLFKPCHLKVDVEEYYKRCVQDTCACNSGGDCECLCSVISAYALKCARKGVPIHWRSQELCPIQCETCDQYSPCISLCPPPNCDTYLDSPDEQTCSNKYCVEGCEPKPCETGHVHRSASNSTCVPVETCDEVPCIVIDGVSYREGQIIEKEDIGDACQSCYCRQGKVECVGVPCQEVTTYVPTSISTPISLEECTNGWSDWINSVHPEENFGNDIESLSSIALEGRSPCPLEYVKLIECRMAGNEEPSELTGQNVTCSIPHGMSCNKRRYSDCFDYEIRFFCQCEEEDKCPVGKEWSHCAFDCKTSCQSLITDLKKNGLCDENVGCAPGCVTSVCEYPYVSRDDTTCVTPDHCTCKLPSGKVLAPGQVHTNGCEKCQCLNNTLICDTTLDCKDEVKDELPTPEDITLDFTPTYEVVTLKPANVTVTPFPALGLVTSTPACSYWSHWINKRKPRRSKKSGDREDTRPHILVQTEGFCSKGSVTAIQCHEAKTDRDYTETGEEGLICDLKTGFKCENKKQPDSRCEDYKIRYLCSCDEATTTTTIFIRSTTPAYIYPCSNFIPLINGRNPIPDSKLKASSSYSSATGPDSARIPKIVSSRAWTPAKSDAKEFIEVDLGEIKGIYGIITRGKWNSREWVTSYQILYSLDGITYSYYQDENDKNLIFSGNYDDESEVKHLFSSSFEAKLVRIEPLTWESRISLNFELLGCSTEEEREDVESPLELRKPTECKEPIGLQNGILLDSQFSASSIYSSEFSPEFARLDSDSVWAAAESNSQQYLQIDFLDEANITGVQTKGREDVAQWVTAYHIEYSNNGEIWYRIKNEDGLDKEFAANYDSVSVVDNDFPVMIRARYLRILPTKWKNWISMQMEVLGCYDPQPCREPMGIDEGELTIYQLSASSKISESHSAANGRLSSRSSWIPAKYDREQFLQMDLLIPVKITGIVTKGDPEVQQWVTSYNVGYSNDSVNWKKVEDKNGKFKEFTGNSNQNSAVINLLPKPITSRYIRILPIKWHLWTSIRLELLGCSHEQNCREPMGLENGIVAEGQITASSAYDWKTMASHARINDDIGWRPDILDRSPHIQVDLLAPRNVSAIVTKGVESDNYWTSKYHIHSSTNGEEWVPIIDDYNNVMEFQGNKDRSSPVINVFPDLVVGRFFRVIPLEPRNKIGLRFELLGCYHPYMCQSPLGMESGKIYDFQVSASSYLNPSLSPSNGRLDSDTAWVPERNDNAPFIQIDMLVPMNITGLMTRGRNDANEWVKSYSISYSDDFLFWNTLRNDFGADMEFNANYDSDSTVTNLFPQPLFTRYLRIKPKDYEKKIALRLEVLGCTHEEVCMDPMGLENGLLSDAQITASSFESESTSPSNARLKSESSWTAAVEDDYQYLQIDFGGKRNISAVVTSGNPNKEEWVTSFQIKHSDDGIYYDYVVDKTGNPINFMSNFDSNIPFTNILPETLETQIIRIQPTDWKNGISMKIEILGCYHPYEIPTVSNFNVTKETPGGKVIIEDVLAKTSIPGQEEIGITEVPVSITQTYDVVCYNPMEKESSLLDDAKVVASSSVPGGDVRRLPLGTRGNRRFKGGWVPKTNDLHPYLYIELPEMKLLTSVYTQGRADEDQWVKSLRVIASLNNKTWLPVFASNGQEVINGNDDRESVVVHYFKKPVEVRYLKVIPESWHRWPSFRLDLRGCHQTAASSSIAPEALKMCPELAGDSELAENCPPSCPSGMVCDGRDCVDPIDCTCFHEGDIFQVSDIIKDPNCKECFCALGGRSVCVEKKCPPCSENERPIVTDDCTCTCEECEPDKVMCPSSHECIPKQRWCDGISDCLDDEINCPSTTTEVTTIAPIIPVTIPPPTNATCDVMGKYINTFDGQDITYDICHHIIMKDQRNGTFNVSLQKECDFKGDCLHWLEVKHRNHKVKVFSDLTVEVNGHNYTASVLSTLKGKPKYRNFYIDKIGDQVVIKSLVKGFTVVYNNKGHLKIEVTPALKTRLSGLCGYYSGRIEDDQKKPDGKLAYTSREFGDSWAVEGFEKECEPVFCPHEVMITALEQCNKLKEEPFTECGKVLQVDHFIEFCMSSVCECLQHKKDTGEKCKCSSFQPFVDECEEKLGPNAVRNWRFKHSCHNDCPPGMEWNDCGPSCQLTCDVTSEESLEHCSEKCVSGCFCPPGTVLNEDSCISPDLCADKTCQGFGDPHLKTFDGLFYPFLAEGSFLIVGDVNNKFSLHGFSRRCNLFSKATCLSGLQLDYNGHKVIIKKKRDIQVDGETVPIDKLPLYKHDMVILGYPGNTYVVVVPQISLEARYYEDNSGFAVKVPSRLYFNKTRGLCGNCNGKKNDEVADVPLNEFVCSFQTEGDKDECKSSLDELPEIPEQNPLCNNLYDPIFEACHPVLDVEVYVDACSFDAVHSGKPKEAMCKTAVEYTRQCCQMGIAINDWPDVLMCDMTCSDDLHYEQCHKGCPQTCASLKNVTDNSPCNQLKTDGCFCPKGQVLKGEDCVSPHLCETCDDEGHVPGDRWKEGECKTCFCTPELKVECDEQICPEKPICSTHETLVKIAHESDEPSCCERYSCAPKDEDCPPPVIPDCFEGEVAKIQTGKFKCPQFKCECDVALCKDIVWPTDLEVGQVAEKIKGFCCPKIIISCNYSSCPEKPACATGLQLTEIEGDCCTTYKCKPMEDVCVFSHQFTVVDGMEIPVKSEDSKISLYKPGENWEDGLCEKCSCETNNGQHFPNCFKELCTNATNSPDNEEYLLREIKVPGKCCPEIYRELCKDRDGYTYQIGEHWTDDDPCVSFICEERELGGVQITRHLIDCPECPKNAELIPPSKALGQCCGICHINKCEENGQLYEVGSVWESADHPCRKAECIKEFETVKTIYSERSCPTLPTDCPKNQIIWDEKGCCKICNVTSEISCSKGPIAEKDTIGFFTFHDSNHGGICTNDNPIPDILQCSGACHSQSYYSLEDGDFKDNCKCCKVNITVNRTIELKCPDGNSIKKTFLQPESCQCSKCAPKNAASDLTNKFSKNTANLNFREIEQTIQQQVDENQEFIRNEQQQLQDEELQQEQNDYDFDEINQLQQNIDFFPVQQTLDDKHDMLQISQEQQ